MYKRQGQEGGCEQRETEKREGSELRGLLPIAPASGRHRSPPFLFFAALGSGLLGQGLGFRGEQREMEKRAGGVGFKQESNSK